MLEPFSNLISFFFFAIYYIPEKTDCLIYTFDCTVEGKIPPGIIDRTKFYKVCLGGKDEVLGGLNFHSWSKLHELTGHRNGPDYLKIDIEGWEFETMQSIIGQPTSPTQIALELHFVIVKKTSSGERLVEDISRDTMVKFYQQMYRGGYYIMHEKKNPLFAQASELLFVRLKCFADQRILPRETVEERLVELQSQYAIDKKTI